jgi:cytochrome c oxidase accessory protein FixG
MDPETSYILRMYGGGSRFGVVWWRWTCPQTVFLDAVFRRIERWIDGDATARRHLDRAPMSVGKAIRRLAKHSLYVLSSFLIAHIFLSYFVSIPELYKMMTSAPTQHWGAFLFVIFLTGVLYFDFAWFREQFCIVMCPYGRLQSALIDDQTVVIGYDEKRGEPRGKPKEGMGDCIDCMRCVQVCPTGVDIRLGLQLECIGCAACVDACDQIMTRLGRPKGLVRYDSLAGFAGARTKWLRPRTVLYAGLMFAGLAAFGFATQFVRPVSLSVLRMPGSPYYLEDGVVRNNFLLRVINKQSSAATLRVRTDSRWSDLRISDGDMTISLAAGAEEQRPLVLLLPAANAPSKSEVEVIVEDAEGKKLASRKVPFLAPYRSAALVSKK